MPRQQRTTCKQRQEQGLPQANQPQPLAEPNLRTITKGVRAQEPEGALGVLPLVVLAQLGVVICIGVLLDTLLVRTVLVPAIAVKLGDRFWWPRRPATRG